MVLSMGAMKLKIKTDMENEMYLILLLNQVRGLQDYEVQHIVYLIWGGPDKLKKIAAKTKRRSRKVAH